LAGLSDDAMDNAKRLLGLMLMDITITNKKDTTTLVSNNAEFTVLPFHDSTSMSLYNRKLDWNRLQSKNSNNEEEQGFKVLKEGRE
jgi:hypothetical protein